MGLILAHDEGDLSPTLRVYSIKSRLRNLLAEQKSRNHWPRMVLKVGITDPLGFMALLLAFRSGTKELSRFV